MTDAAASSNGAAPEPKVETVPLEKFQRVQAQIVDMERKLERFKDIDPDGYKAMKEDYELMRKQQTGGDPKKIDELVTAKEAEIRSSVQKALDALKEENQNYKGKLKELQVTDTVFSKAASKFNADCHDDVKDYIRRFGDVGDDGTIIFKDEKGKERYAPGSTTKLMDVDQFIGWLAETKPSWAVPQGTGGAKSPGVKMPGEVAKGVVLTRELVASTPDQGRALFADLCKTKEGYAQVQAYLLNRGN